MTRDRARYVADLLKRLIILSPGLILGRSAGLSVTMTPTSSASAMRVITRNITAVMYMDKCPRCGGLLNTNYGEPNCVCCGYTDYTSSLSEVRRPKPLRGVTVVLRRHTPLNRRHVKSILMRQIHDNFVIDECPFDGCSSLMEETKTVKKIPRFRIAAAFTCEEDHIIYHVHRGNKEWWI